MYSCDLSWIFSIITPVFSVTWSFSIINMLLIQYNHQSSNIIVIIKVMLLNIFVETVTHFYSISLNLDLCLLINLMHLCWIQYYFLLIKVLLAPNLAIHLFVCLYTYLGSDYFAIMSISSVYNILCVYTVISIHLHHSQYFIVFLWLSGRGIALSMH